MDCNNNATKIAQKSKSFSISAILSSKNGSESALKRKREDHGRVAIGRQGVATLIRSDSEHDCVTVTLENRGLWEIFHDVGTEMVITKSGRRMFPALKVTVAGLDPSLKYIVMMDVIPADNYRYKYHESEWLVTGKAYPDVPKSKRVHHHNESPCNGAKWMSSVISFHKVKITNNATASKSGQIVLNSLHKYQPRIHIMQAGNFRDVVDENSMVFVFRETSFMAVTAYQSEQITQLKIDNNPFAKGFRDPSPSDIERAQLMNSMHLRIPEYAFGNGAPNARIPFQGRCPQSQCVLPFASASDAWLVQSHMLPRFPQQPPIGLQVMSAGPESSKRVNHARSPVCQCTNGNSFLPCDVDYKANRNLNEEAAQVHPPVCPDSLCACTSRRSSVLPLRSEHLSRPGSPSQSPLVMRNMVNYPPPRLYSCSCCIDHRQFEWTSHTGHMNVKSPVF